MKIIDVKYITSYDSDEVDELGEELKSKGYKLVHYEYMMLVGLNCAIYHLYEYNWFEENLIKIYDFIFK